ncbi:MAG TPA: protein translocase subunit SecF [Acidimicrobiales bacterium]|nr:protein translocase subunit SecF [Acidimicrobiales bacterium]
MSALVRLYRGQNNVWFPKWWRRAMIFSSALIMISVVSLATRGLNLGIDFVGGVSWQVRAPGVSVDHARTELGVVAGSGTKIQTVGDSILVEAPKASSAKVDQVRHILADLGHTSPSQVNVSTVGPSWGKDISQKAEQALVVFLLALLLYLSLRLEWKMAVAAILAMVHDVVISVGVYSVFQFEVTPETVVAFLTILGYSIYDTIVVFDKVRENQARPAVVSRLTYTDLANLSMNQVFMRSINTSLVALLPVVCMLVVGAGILGAVALEQFSIALLVGLSAGAYSSIFIAAPILVFLKEREPRNRSIRERIESGRVSAPTLAEAEVPLDDVVDADEDEAIVSGPRHRPEGHSPTATAPRPAAPATTIPPRPRKKGKRR